MYGYMHEIICMGLTYKVNDWNGTHVMYAQRELLHAMDRSLARDRIVERWVKVGYLATGLLLCSNQLNKFDKPIGTTACKSWKIQAFINEAYSSNMGLIDVSQVNKTTIGIVQWLGIPDSSICSCFDLWLIPPLVVFSIVYRGISLFACAGVNPVLILRWSDLYYVLFSPSLLPKKKNNKIIQQLIEREKTFALYPCSIVPYSIGSHQLGRLESLKQL